VLANSESVARSATRDEGVPPSKITVIPNFADDALFETPPVALRAETRSLLGIRPEQHVIVCVANLRPVKNHALLLDALAGTMAVLPGVLLLLVGDGPARGALERRAKELLLSDQVIFLGQRHDAWRYHAAGDLSVLSSVSEGFPNALVEAQALGVPVVATAVGGVADVVVDKVTGLLVPEGDAAAMTNALLTLLSDPDRRRAMGLAAQAATRTRFSRDAVMGRILGLYRELVL
jgi:glycosyltransferase involved in cell wall biosynthesis